MHFYHSLAKTLSNFLNIVKISPGSVGSWTQKLNECWLRVRGFHSHLFCHPHTLKPLNTLVQQVAVGICTSASLEPSGVADLEAHGT